MTVTIATWSIEDYHHIISTGILDERYVELLDGEIVEMAPEREPHAYASDEGAEYLMVLLGDRAKVRQAKPIAIPSSQSEPEPDIAIVHRLGKTYLEHHPYPENIFWIIEYASTSLKKDLEVKSRIYAAADIPEYWVVDLRSQEIVVFRSPVDGGYQTKTVVKTGPIYAIAFPNLSISCDRLFGS